MTVTTAGVQTTPLAGYNPQPDQMLGWIIWWTVRSAWVKPADLEAWFNELDLDPAYLHTRLSKTEAFRRAYSPHEHTYTYTYDAGSGTEATLKCEEIKLDKTARRERLVRQIVRRTTSTSRRNVAFDTEIARATFWKRKGEVTVQMLSNDPVDLPHVVQYLDELRANYERRTEHLDSDRLRGVLRNHIEGINSIKVRESGGVYFVHANRERTLRSLQELAHRLSPRSSLHAIPLPDTPEQRDMVTEAFNTEVLGKASTLLEHTLTVAAKPTKDSLQEVRDDFYDLRSRINEYISTLSLSRDRAEATLELVEEAIVDAMDRLPEEDDQQ